MSEDATTAEAGSVTAQYRETETERLLLFRRDGSEAAVAQNIDELERYYGFDMALDHAGELLGVASHELPVPDAAADMGM